MIILPVLKAVASAIMNWEHKSLTGMFSEYKE